MYFMRGGCEFEVRAKLNEPDHVTSRRQLHIRGEKPYECGATVRRGVRHLVVNVKKLQCTEPGIPKIWGSS